ncbi:MAG TPA: hypothetical protein PK821_04160 [Victivallales bacterium]|nr:hypothetical protein [Victivallales bacterium]
MTNKRTRLETVYRFSKAAVVALLFHIFFLVFVTREGSAYTFKPTQENVYILPEGSTEESELISGVVKYSMPTIFLAPDHKYGFSSLLKKNINNFSHSNIQREKKPDILSGYGKTQADPLKQMNEFLSAPTVLSLFLPSPLPSVEVFETNPKNKIDYPIVFDSFGRNLRDIATKLTQLDSSKSTGETQIEFTLKGTDRINLGFIRKASSDNKLDEFARKIIAPYVLSALEKSNAENTVITIYWKE